jgi:hypothetical protein
MICSYENLRAYIFFSWLYLRDLSTQMEMFHSPSIIPFLFVRAYNLFVTIARENGSAKLDYTV